MTDTTHKILFKVFDNASSFSINKPRTINKYLWFLICLPLFSFAEKEVDCQKAFTVIDTLNQSQQAWLSYRKAHCDAVYEQWSGGTIRGTMFGGCMLRLTQLRIHVIWQDYLTYMDSTEPLLPEPEL